MMFKKTFNLIGLVYTMKTYYTLQRGCEKLKMLYYNTLIKVSGGIQNSW